jgi:hypothetical protein
VNQNDVLTTLMRYSMFEASLAMPVWRRGGFAAAPAEPDAEEREEPDSRLEPLGASK